MPEQPREFRLTAAAAGPLAITAAEGKAPPRPEPVAEPALGRHWVAPEEQPSQEPAAEAPDGQHTGGHSVADLMSRLQVNGPVSGGGRRRRED